jgi:hypothetical protein
LYYTDARVQNYLTTNNYATEAYVSTTTTNSANWDTAYSWGDHSLVGYLTSFTETDPIYTASSWYTTTNNAANWDTAFGWGNHASAGYLTSFTESDPVFTASAASGITSTNISNWNTAYGWGNHASQGYATQTYVNTAVSGLVDAAPATLDTLNELAAALGDDPNFATTVSTSIGTKWTQDNAKISNWDTAFGWGNHASAGYLTSISEATSTVRGGIELFSDTDQSVAANAVTATSGRTYGIQLNSAGQAVVNVPWTDTNTTYSVGNGGLTEINFTSALNTKLAGIATSANNYSHPSYTARSINTSGAAVLDILTVDTSGHVTAASTRNLTLADLGYTGATNANYITNTNQLTNGAGFLTALNDRVYITDSRGAARAPSFYDDRYTQFDFQNTADTGAGGDTWHVLQTISPWSAYDNSHRQQQLVFTGTGGIKFRYASSETVWTGWQTLWTSGNDGSGSGLDADTVDGLQASSFLRSDADNSSVRIGTRVTLAESADRADLLEITGTTSTWAGLQIRNSSNEGRWSFMTDGEMAGIYNDEDNQWSIQMDEVGEVRLYHNGIEKLNTQSSGVSVSGDLDITGNLYGRSVNGQYSSLYRMGGIYFTWDSDSYGTNFEHSITSTFNGSYGDHLTINSFGHVKINVDSNGNGTNTFSVGRHTTGDANNMMILDESSNMTVYGSVRSPIFYDSNDTNSYFDANRVILRGSDPTVIFRDTNHNSAMLHCNSNLFYILRGGNDTTTWTQVNGQWPATWNLTNNLYSGGGAATFVGDVTANTSDRRLKENVKNIPNAIEKVKSINGVTFDWKEDLEDINYTRLRIHDVGVIAQEIQAVLPDAVRPAPFDTDEEGNSRSGENYLTVQYEKIVPLLIEAIKEQQQQIDELKSLLNK